VYVHVYVVYMSAAGMRSAVYMDVPSSMLLPVWMEIEWVSEWLMIGWWMDPFSVGASR